MFGAGKCAQLEDSCNGQKDGEYDPEGDPGQKATKEEREQEQHERSKSHYARDDSGSLAELGETSELEILVIWIDCKCVGVGVADPIRRRKGISKEPHRMDRGVEFDSHEIA